MAKQPKKKPKAREDVAQTAFRVMREATGQAPKTPDPGAKKKAGGVKKSPPARHIKKK